MRVFLLGLLLVLSQPSWSVESSYSSLSKFTTSIAKLSSCVEFSVTSWIRSPKRNKIVGGSEKSLHIQGLAVDIVLDNKEDMPYFVRRATSLGLNVRVEGDHIHVSQRLTTNTSGGNDVSMDQL